MLDDGDALPGSVGGGAAAQGRRQSGSVQVTAPCAPLGFPAEHGRRASEGIAASLECARRGSTEGARRGSSSTEGARRGSASSQRRASRGSDAAPAQKGLGAAAELQDVQNLRELQQIREKREQELVRAYIKNNLDARHASLRLSSLQGKTVWQTRVHRVISHWAFDSIIGAVICFNAVTIGVETTYTAKDELPPGWVDVLEYIFIVVYSLELSMRVYVYRCLAFQSRWVVFDAFLVMCGLVDVAVKLAVNASEVLANIMLVRLLRLARLARAARLLVQFRVLWLLVQGLMNSFLTITWTMVLLIVLIYIFAVLGLEIVRPDESAGADYEEAVTKFNDSLGRSMLVLIQFLTMDSVGPIYVPICLAKPYLTIYFVAYFLVVSITIMNLVTALMVDNALSQSSQDKEAERAWEAASRKRALPRLKSMFTELDEDGSGCLELEEILNAPEELKEQLQQIAKIEDCEELFHMLDYDNSGTIDVDEFCDGVLKVSQDNKPLELLRLARQCTAIHESTKATLRLVRDSTDRPSSPEHGAQVTAHTLAVGAEHQDTSEASPDAKANARQSGQAKARPGSAGSAVLDARMSTMDSRMSGLDARLAGVEALLQSIDSAVRERASPTGFSPPSPTTPRPGLAWHGAPCPEPDGAGAPGARKRRASET